MIKRSYYHNSITNFTEDSQDKILGELASNHHFALDIMQINGWGGRIRTCACRYQKPVPYRLATPQCNFRKQALKSIFPKAVAIIYKSLSVIASPNIRDPVDKMWFFSVIILQNHLFIFNLASKALLQGEDSGFPLLSTQKHICEDILS